METIRIKNKHIELEKLDKLINAKIPSGMNIRETPHKFNDEIELANLRCYKEINEHPAIHSGSRYLGNEAAKLYQEMGFNRLNGNDKRALDHLITEYKAAGRDKDIQTAIKELKNQVLTNIPYPLSYVDSDLFDDYIHDMQIVQHFAILNRKAMADEIIRGL